MDRAVPVESYSPVQAQFSELDSTIIMAARIESRQNVRVGLIFDMNIAKVLSFPASELLHGMAAAIVYEHRSIV